ncbi:CRISPR-associated protein Cas5 [Pseudomonas akapageensis]|uniref:CRISPR-associated protein Cas5 n=1 Tax=Pseudomonas akapageensis TaxID=2609961 RepID=UPI003CCCACFD
MRSHPAKSTCRATSYQFKKRAYFDASADTLVLTPKSAIIGIICSPTIFKSSTKSGTIIVMPSNCPSVMV